MTCTSCGADIRLLAFISEAALVRRILIQIGAPAEAPRIAPARGPPAWDILLEEQPEWGTLAPRASEFEFDQRICW